MLAHKALKYSSPFFSKNFSTLVLGQTFNGAPSPNILNVVTAAKQFKEDIDVLLPLADKTQVPEFIKKIPGLRKIFLASHETLKNPQSTGASQLALQLIKKQNDYTQVLAPASTYGKDIIPRLGGMMDLQPISESKNQFQRPIYAGNAICRLTSQQKMQLLTVRTTNFDKVPLSQKDCEQNFQQFAQIEDYAKKFQELGLKFVANHVSESQRPDLTAARFVVSGGRGMKNGQNFKILYDLAEALGGSNTAVGASRAAVDAGYVPNQLQVGQTGKVVAPQLYIAVGISGAIQHLAGMKDSKVIVAINKDPQAPIFQVANYGIVGDLFKVVPELTDSIRKGN